MTRVKLVEQSRANDVDEMKRILGIIYDQHEPERNDPNPRDVMDPGNRVDPDAKPLYEADDFDVGEIVRYNPFMSQSFWVGEIVEILEGGSMLLKPVTQTQEFYADKYAQSYKTVDGLYEVRNLECNKFLKNKKEYFKWRLQNGD